VLGDRSHQGAVYLFGKLNFRLDAKIAQTLFSDESNEENVPEQNGYEAPNYINTGFVARDLRPVYGERSQVMGKYECQDHMCCEQERQKLGRPHQAKTVGNSDYAAHNNQENDVCGPARPRIA